MSGRKFHQILRYLHVCSQENQSTRLDDNYGPVYKVKELMEALEVQYNKLFMPCRNLSLDETLVRAFGQIKFKVRITTKAAHVG
jgi:Transposase IS4